MGVEDGKLVMPLAGIADIANFSAQQIEQRSAHPSIVCHSSVGVNVVESISKINEMLARSACALSYTGSTSRC